MSTKSHMLRMLQLNASIGLPVRRSDIRASRELKHVAWPTIKTAVSRLRSEGYDILTRQGQDPEYELILPGRKQ